MKDDETKLQPGELEAMKALAESPDPMTRVIYHMSTRTLAMAERQSVMEAEIMLQGGSLRRLVEALERRLTNGSRPDLKAVVYGEK